MKERKRMLDKNNMTLEFKKMTISQVSENRISKNELSKKKSLKEKGITLIALVVTIIILLILAGVTLNMALSQNGLFSKTQEAADKYRKAQEDEEIEIEKIEYVADGKDITEVETISDKEGLEEFREKVNSGDNFENTLVKLSSDLDLGGETWEPIGTKEHPFNGVFNGNGYKINNIKLEDASDEYENDDGWKWIGLFGYNEGIIKNVGIVGVTITNSITNKCGVGIIAGINTGKVERCYNKAKVECNVGVLGGIVGYLNKDGHIIECYNEGNLDVTPNETEVGLTCGIAGWVYAGLGNGSITKCYNKGNITCHQTSKSNYMAAGICSVGSIIIDSNYNVGTITLENKNGSNHAGPVSAGIIGQTTHDSVISNCYNIGDIIVDTTQDAEGIRSGSITGLLDKNVTLGSNFGFCSNGLETIGPKLSGAELIDTSKVIKYENKNEMKSIAKLLGPNFKEDKTGKINNGFPILAWQEE